MIRIESNMYVHMDGMYSTKISGLYGKYVRYLHITLHKLQRSQYIKELSSTVRRVGPQLTTHLFGVMQQHTVCVLLCLIVGQIVTV